jgi:2-oxoglutarate ferredoxin oxidoreductase subunit alpha
VPQPVADEKGAPVGIIAYGTTHHAVVEARDRLRADGLETDYLRVRALPLSQDIAAFVERHDRVYVIEQNRDGQLYTLLRAELPAHLVDRLSSIRHYDGVPIDASAVSEPLLDAEKPVLA